MGEIPEEAVEAAARAIDPGAFTTGPTTTCYTDDAPHASRRRIATAQARSAVTAALPHLSVALAEEIPAWIEVYCSQCHAAPGERCHHPNGGAYEEPHKVRLTLASRSSAALVERGED